MMFTRFTRGAREVVAQAQAEAHALGHGWIGTEHLLLGIAAAPGDASRVLADNGATPEALRAAVQAEIGSAPLDGDALAAIGIDLDAIRRRVEAAFGPGALDRALCDHDGRDRWRRRRRAAGHIPFTPRAKRGLERSLQEALAMHDDHIGPEHVLLGLLSDDRTVAVAALRRAGALPERIREASRRGRAA